MGYNLGNYANDLSIDDYNKALTAGGSDYQMQQSAATAAPTASADMSGSGYAMPSATASTPDMSGNAYALAAPEPPSPTQQYQPPAKEPEKAGLVNRILPMVGGLIGGPVGAAIGGAIGNKDATTQEKTTSLVGGILGG